MSVYERVIDDTASSIVNGTVVCAPTPSVRAEPRVPLFLIDLVALLSAWAAVLVVARDGELVDLRAAIAAAVAGVLAAQAQGLYGTCVGYVRAVVTTRLVRTAVTSTAAAVAVLVVAGDLGGRMPATAAGGFIAYVALTSGRVGFDAWIRLQRSRGRFRRRIVLIGCESDVRDLAAFLAVREELGYEVAGWVGPLGEHPGRLGETHSAMAAVRETDSSGALVLAAGMGRDAVNTVTRELLDAGVLVFVWSGLAGINHRRMVAVPIGHEPFVHVAPASTTRAQLVAKRAIDVVGAALALLVLAPVIAVAAYLVKRHDGGPVLFRQVRVGQNGRPIVVHKLRTMTVDAEARQAELVEANERDGPLFKVDHDPRVTPIGALLRRTSIDELPQLIDVLRGDLSLVGPRPALPAEVARFDGELLGRLRVRPGITGLWQVEGRDKRSFDFYRRLDLFYVDNWSLTLDLAILLETIPAVIARSRPGARRTAA